MRKKVLVMIPGPTPVVESIRTEMGRPIQAFNDPRFVKDYKSVIDDLATMFNCRGKTFVLTGSGTLAMEMAIANTTKCGDNILIVSNGFFGDRFIDICKHKSLNIDVLSAEWGNYVTPEEIDKKLSEKNYAAMTVTHVDTSTGVVSPIAEIGKVVAKHPGVIYIVDSVAAAGGEYVNVGDMGIDILFTCSQKSFGVCPGILILWADKKALARRKELGTIPEYYIDFEKWIPIMDDPAKYFSTPSVNLIWALKESVAIIKEEGIKNRADRHRRNADAVVKAMESIGFRILAKPGCRTSTLSVAIYPEGVNDAKFRSIMMEEGVIVSGALGAYAGKAFRLGHMGNATENEIIVSLSAIERALKACGIAVEPGKAVGTYIAEIERTKK